MPEGATDGRRGSAGDGEAAGRHGVPELSYPPLPVRSMTQVSEPETAVALPEQVLGSLSPSRAADFKACPLLYRFRCVDRLPEPPSLAATRGTLVHAVLESLFYRPAAERTLETARGLLPAAWDRVQAEEPAVTELFAGDPDGAAFADWIGSAAELLGTYFRLEDPTRLEPEAREQ